MSQLPVSESASIVNQTPCNKVMFYYLYNRDFCAIQNTFLNTEKFEYNRT